MTKEEAIKITLTKFKNRIVDKVTETDKYFLINLVGKGSKAEGVTVLEPFNDGLKAVDKQTKEVFTYNPIRHK